MHVGPRTRVSYVPCQTAGLQRVPGAVSLLDVYEGLGFKVGSHAYHVQCRGDTAFKDHFEGSRWATSCLRKPAIVPAHVLEVQGCFPSC
jgi:hypothetical protein